MPTSATLDRRFRPFADRLLKAARALDKRFAFTSTRRSRTEQQRLYNRWQAGQSPFPAAVPGTSRHEKGLAVDIARLGVDPTADELLPLLGAAWKELGGRWAGPGDPVHFEAPRSW